MGGRYSYTATLLSLVAPNIALDYRDFQVRASYDLGPRDRVSMLNSFEQISHFLVSAFHINAEHFVHFQSSGASLKLFLHALQVAG